MPSKYNDGLTHGHCRWGECSCIFVGVWVERHSNAEDCPSGPWSICPCCVGECVHEGAPGKLFDCTVCLATGEVPGPHWPWRFPEPPPIQWGMCAGLIAAENSKAEYAKQQKEKAQQEKQNDGGGRPEGGSGGRWVDPRTLDLRGGYVNPAAVAYYKEHPFGKFDNEQEWKNPIIRIQEDGTPFLMEGRHRAEAAIQEGRMLYVEDWTSKFTR